MDEQEKQSNTCDSCGANLGEEIELDACPFDAEILDRKTLCRCCEDCRRFCLWET